MYLISAQVMFIATLKHFNCLFCSFSLEIENEII